MGHGVSVPYSEFVENGVPIGSELYIAGRAEPNYDSFSINLCVMPTMEGGDVALHFNPRRKEKAIVRNYKVGGVWGPEERDGKFIINQDGTFALEIKAHEHGYKVRVDMRHTFDFTHRIPREYVQYLHIKGQVKINRVRYAPGTNKNQKPSIPYQPTPQFPAGGVHPMFQGGQVPPMYPGMYPPGAGVPGYPPAPGFPQAPGYPQYPGFAAQSAPVFNPPVPVNLPIPGAFTAGKMIFITGIPKLTANRFRINLACGPSETSDLALHFDVRFKYGNDQNVVVCTSRQGGKFGKEERQHSVFPFKKGEQFEIIILGK